MTNRKNGYFIIASTQVNNYKEVRLMTKFDHESSDRGSQGIIVY
ncbi:type II restriction enzyme [Iocasia frigidifontis]